jgi:hypothetical protein
MIKLKYPKTFHLPWSKGINSDDKVNYDLSNFLNKRVIVTEKLDGECSTLTNEYYHARSLDTNYHPSRDWIKKFHANIKNDIPKNFRICGENVYAKHSIFYENLTTYFYVYNIWDDYKCLNWNETLEYCKLLNLQTVPILYDGIYNEKIIKECYTDKSIFSGQQEGYVVRIADEFYYDDFINNMAKYVRENHVQTSEHWLNEKVIPNLLIK